MSGLIHFELSKDEALIAFDWLSDLPTEHLSEAEKIACEALVAALEKRLTGPFAPNYGELVAEAGARLIEHA